MNRNGNAVVNAIDQAGSVQACALSRTIAIKFCGGCNPTFDRLYYWDKIKKETAGAIRWTSPDHPHPDGLLLICGCHTSCPLKFFNPEDYTVFLLVNNHEEPPEAIAEKLIT